MKDGFQVYLICPCVILAKSSAWHSQQISAVCICCELEQVQKKKKEPLFCPSFQRKYYQLGRSRFKELEALAAGL